MSRINILMLAMHAGSSKSKNGLLTDNFYTKKLSSLCSSLYMYLHKLFENPSCSIFALYSNRIISEQLLSHLWEFQVGFANFHCLDPLESFRPQPYKALVKAFAVAPCAAGFEQDKLLLTESMTSWRHCFCRAERDRKMPKWLKTTQVTLLLWMGLSAC